MQERRRALSAPLFESFANSSAAQVFEAVLASIYDGSLRPGDAISENDLARRHGVSRTPAREAVQRLRELGLVEASAGRTSRVVFMTQERLRQSLVVWEALMSAVVDEVIDVISDADIAVMEDSVAEFSQAFEDRDPAAAAQATFDVFAAVVARSENPVLVKTLALTVHAVRLGGLSLPGWLDAPRLGAAQTALVTALRARDAAAAKAALQSAAAYRLLDDPNGETSSTPAPDRVTSSTPAPDQPKDR